MPRGRRQRGLRGLCARGRSSGWLAAGLAGAVALGCRHGLHARDATSSGPARDGLDALGAPGADVAAAWAQLDAGCDGCHTEHAREHAASAHGRAFTNPVFQAEYAGTRSPACVRCHAPLADPTAPDRTAASAARGVGCLLCHTPHLGAEAATATAMADTPWPARVGCADCHDFPVEWLDGRGAYAPGQRLQRTAREHAQSAESAAGRSCVDCHAPRPTPGMPGAPGHTRHDWPGARDEATLASALRIEATVARARDGVLVEVQLRSVAGHAVPTGDVFRALVVVAQDARRPLDERGEPRAAVARLERRFRPTRDGLQEVGDDRVPADGRARVVRLTLPADCAEVEVSVEWQAVRPSAALARGLADADVRRLVWTAVRAVPPD